MGFGNSFGISSETNNNIQTKGLVFYIDAAYKKSYPRSGTVWTDLVGANNGTLTNGPTFNSDDGGSIVFDGVNDVVTVPDNSTLEIDAVTISIWTQFGSDVDGFAATVFGRTGGGNSPYKIRSAGSAATSNIYFQTRNSDASLGVGPTVTPGSTFSLNEWVNLSFSYDYDNSDARMQVYVNGQLHDSNTSGGATLKIDSSQSFEAMRSAHDGAHRSGKIANVQIYNRGLTASDVLQNYNAQKQRFGL